jgi:hypothetical protein
MGAINAWTTCFGLSISLLNKLTSERVLKERSSFLGK